MARKQRLSPTERFRLDIAGRTLRMNDVFVSALGGMSKKEARTVVRQYAERA